VETVAETATKAVTDAVAEAIAKAVVEAIRLTSFPFCPSAYTSSKYM
jgi:hypothetical protein